MKKILYLLIVIPILISSAISKQYTRKADSLELIKLYNSTNGEHWRHKVGWYNFSPVNSWYGITLDTIKNGNDLIFTVKEINLQNNKLEGQLPDLDLPDISILYLAGNSLTGELPNFIMPNLKIMYLTGNNITGDLPDFDMPLLEILELSGNKLSGEIPNFNLPKLKLLNLNYNKLTGNIPELNCPNLESLYLANNKITGDLINFKLPKLRILNLQNNEMTGHLPNLNLPQLQVLQLERNSFSGAIPNFNLPNLTDLNLSYNNFSGTLPKFNLPALRILECQYNYLSESFPELDCPYLESVRINNNSIVNLPDLKYLKRLHIFKAKKNKLTFEDIEPNISINDFDYTEQDTLLPIQVDLQGNSFTLTVIAKGDSNIYQWYRDDKAITGANQENYSGNVISEYYCKISNKIAKNLILYTKRLNPKKKIYALKSDSLELVKLYKNNGGENWKRKQNWMSEALMIDWYGVVTDTIVKGGDSLLVVSELKLGNNKLSGSLKNIDLPYLKYIDLFNNDLNGDLPSFTSSNIQSIDLSNNYFDGELPNYNFPELTSLDLSNNELEGEIPNYDFPKLEYLNLSGNKLSNKIPQFNFSNLDLLDLSYNSLTGIIPQFNLPIATDINLDDNQLSGDVPEFEMPELRSLSLNNNVLTGLPELKKLKSLEDLFVEHNKLTFEDLELNVSIPNFNYKNQDTLLPLKYKVVDGEIELSVVANGMGNRYQWQRYSVDIVQANEDKIIAKNSGPYRCKITNIMATELTLYSEEIDPTTINVNDLYDRELDFGICPNPVNSEGKIHFYLTESTNAKIILYDLYFNKKVILNSKYFVSGEHNISFNTNDLSSGTYYLQIVFNQTSLIKSFIVVK